MKLIVPLIAAGLLTACSGQTPAGNTATDMSATDTTAANGVEEVMPSEGNMAAAASDTGVEANDSAAGPTAAATEADYLGRWVGVEGMILNVAAKPGGGVTLDMRWGLDDDMAGKFDGSVTAEGLRFTRNGVAETAVRTDGDATGLKWLAGKKDCLTVKSGEGYCRA